MYYDNDEMFVEAIKKALIDAGLKFDFVEMDVDEVVVSLKDYEDKHEELERFLSYLLDEPDDFWGKYEVCRYGEWETEFFDALCGYRKEDLRYIDGEHRFHTMDRFFEDSAIRWWKRNAA